MAVPGVRLHRRAVDRRPEEGEGLRRGAALPRRQGLVHHPGAVREHPAVGGRPEGWDADRRGPIRLEGSQVKQALDLFGEALDWSTRASGLCPGTRRPRSSATAGCAFETMNDSALRRAGQGRVVDGKTFHEVAFPGTEASYVAVVDTFVQAKSATNAKNAADFLASHRRPEHAAGLQQGQGLGAGADRRGRQLPVAVPAVGLDRAAQLASAVVDRARLGDESGRSSRASTTAVNAYVRTRDAKRSATTLIDAVAAAPPQRYAPTPAAGRSGDVGLRQQHAGALMPQLDSCRNEPGSGRVRWTRCVDARPADQGRLHGCVSTWSRSSRTIWRR